MKSISVRNKPQKFVVRYFKDLELYEFFRAKGLSLYKFESSIAVSGCERVQFDPYDIVAIYN